MLLAHEAKGFDEWAASAAVRPEPNLSSRGLSLSLSPSVGTLSGGDAGQLPSFDERVGPSSDEARPATLHLDAEAGYGFRGTFGRGTMTPYAGATLAGESHTWRTGARWELRPYVVLGLEATRTELANASSEHGILLRMAARW